MSSLFGSLAGLVIILTCASFIARKERIALFSILSIYFLLYFGSNIAKLM